jgi:glycosyltransferase involved in cell wall biosynthesis
VLPFPRTAHFARSASPLKLFEYMAAGRPIVASALESVEEVVEDERTALLVPPSDPDALASALARLADDPGLAERLGAAAREAVTPFAWRARARCILAELGAVMSARRRDRVA